MQLNYDENRSMLKLAQFKALLDKHYVDRGVIELFIQDLDINLKVPSTKFLELRCKELIGSTPLHLAYAKKQVDVFNILMSKGSDFNIKDNDGRTVLHKSFIEAIDRYDYLKSRNNKRLTNAINRAHSFINSILSAHVRSKNALNSSDPDGLTHFHIACALNNVKVVELFLNEGVPVNLAVKSKYFAGNTPLHFAVDGTSVEVVKILLKHGADVNLKNANGRTPMDICINKNMAFIASHCIRNVEKNEEIMNLLMNDYDSTELSHLHVVSSMQNSCQAENLLSQRINVNQTISKNAQIWPGFTALHFAVYANIETVKLLIKHGANIQAREAFNGASPFDACVIRYEAEEIFKILCLIPSWKNLLLSDGKTKLTDLIFAFKDMGGITDFLQKSDENINLFVPFDSSLWPGCTVLHLAVILSQRANYKLDYRNRELLQTYELDLSIIKRCLNQGADVTVKNFFNMTPIHLAFRFGKPNIVNLLLKYHHTMINSVDPENLSHLHIACAAGNRNLVEKFLWNKIDANIKYKGKCFISCVAPGSTPLHVAASKRDLEIVRLLLKFGADVHATDYRNYTAIHYLHDDHGSYELSRVLFSRLNLSDCVDKGMGSNLLHIACATKNIDAVKKLLDLDVDVNKPLTYIKVEGCKNNTKREFNNGNTALHSLLINSPTSQRQIAIARLLIERGADILGRNSFRVSALRLILVSSNLDLADVIISALRGNHCLRRRIKSEIGLTLLHLACYKVDYALTKELLDNGAKINVQIHENSAFWPGLTPLHLLIYNMKNISGEVENNMVRLLLTHRASVTLYTKYTALHTAWNKYKKSPGHPIPGWFKSLVKSQENFEINPTNIAGVSHFHIACDLLDVGTVEKFLKHNVDINLRIDIFSYIKFAGCTPLLLVTQKTDLTQRETFAQLRIIDLLLKHGADVNAEDVSGNTPAHFAASINYSSRRQNVLQRLINGGADVNARNVQGETPLESLLNMESLGHQELRHFISCGCIFNSFNSVTETGYIAIACTVVSFEQIHNLLFGTFINFPETVKKDCRNRTVIHNIVSMPSTELDEEDTHELGLIFNAMKTFGCDVDDQENLGRTPLHIATLFRYSSAIEKLISNGADINIIDKYGKTPFAYIFEPCSRHCSFASGKNHNQFSHTGIFKLYVNYIKKLHYFNLEVNQMNEDLYREALQVFDDVLTDQDNFLEDTEEFRKCTIDPLSLTVNAFLSDFVAVVDYPTMPHVKRKAIDAFFDLNQMHFHIIDQELAGISQLQYRKAIKRNRIIDLSLNALTVVTNAPLPDHCSHVILRFLTNSDLGNVIAAAFHDKDSRMEVD